MSRFVTRGPLILRSSGLSRQGFMGLAAQARGYAKASASTPAKKDSAALRQQREKNQKKQDAKREVQRDLNSQRDTARYHANSPSSMDLVKAMRYIRAAEVGQPSSRSTVVVRIQIVDDRSAPKVTGVVRIPKPVGGDRIAVVTGSSEAAEEARAAGASIVANESLLVKIANGEPIEFDRLYATPDMSSRLITVARVLGPKGLMPSAKRGTVTSHIGEAIQSARGEAVVKQMGMEVAMPIGLAAFSDLDMARNINAVVSFVRTQLAASQAKRKGFVGRIFLTSGHMPAIAIKA